MKFSNILLVLCGFCLGYTILDVYLEIAKDKRLYGKFSYGKSYSGKVIDHSQNDGKYELAVRIMNNIVVVYNSNTPTEFYDYEDGDSITLIRDKYSWVLPSAFKIEPEGKSYKDELNAIYEKWPQLKYVKIVLVIMLMVGFIALLYSRISVFSDEEQKPNLFTLISLLVCLIIIFFAF